VRRLAIFGGGAWGTALAITARRAGSEPVLWARDAALAAAINTRHENPVFLPGIALDPTIAATTDPEAALDGAEAALMVVPAQFLRGVLTRIAPKIPLLLCAKGIENGSLMTMSEMAGEVAPDVPVAVLSGPSFAAEVAHDKPAAVVIASRDDALARGFMAALGTARFRPYLSHDPIGAEIGGAAKNVLAIACGITDGCGLGDNARAALITRGLAEIARLGVAKGADPDTFRGLSGMGDVVLTCAATQSRNHALGAALGQGMSLAEALSGSRAVVEGVATAASLAELAGRLGVEMPITRAVDGVLHRGLAIDTMIEALLSRPYRAE
jgi:glycerol-3-phosphate dehydrogenase (NAD(P)+)